VAGAGTLLVAWLLFQHIPSWYRPSPVPPGEVQRVKDDLTRTFDILSGALVHEETSFRLRFTQDQINAWLAIREQIWPETRHWLPPELSEPFVSIDEEGLRLAATYHQGGLQTVVSARLELEADTDGISARLAGVSGGALGVPQAWVRDQLLVLDATAWPVGERPRAQIGGDPLPPLSRLFEGIRLPNAWVWANGKRPFRIIDISFEPGAGVVTFEPLERQLSTR
jgi:hypothetical protein